MKITNLIKLLQTYGFYDISDTIEIAKGKYQASTDLTSLTRKFKRKWLKK